MDNAELTSLPISAGDQATPALAADIGFDTRWAAWVERGRAHERRVRRRFVVWAGVLMMGASILYAFLRS